MKSPAQEPQADSAVGFFDSSVASYESKHYGKQVRSFMTVRQRRVMEVVDGLSLVEGTRVLDAGCGPGFLLSSLASRGLHVFGTDAAQNMLRAARNRLSESSPRALFSAARIESLPYASGSFDVVCSTGVIEYLPEDSAALLEFARVLRPGGSLILPVTNWWSPINWFDAVLEGLKRQSLVRRVFNHFWVRRSRPAVVPRRFQVRRHRPGSFRRALARAGFRMEEDLFFHFLPWPHPFDALFPSISARLGESMERFGRSRFGVIAEGYLVKATRVGSA